MLSTKNVIHGFFDFGPNRSKYKYLISIHNEGNSNIFVSFTTSQKRGYFKGKDRVLKDKEGNPRSYVFYENTPIGVDSDKNPWSFPQTTSIVFDYSLDMINSVEAFFSNTRDLTLKCTLYDKEYIDLVYAIYQSNDTSEQLKPILEEILKKNIT